MDSEEQGTPEWVVRYVRNFMRGRRTRVAFDEYQSEWIQTNSGIPHRSPISPILFLFFISELLEGMQNVEKEVLGFGFVDDTNIITWSGSAQENCRRLEAAHDRCIACARSMGQSSHWISTALCILLSDAGDRGGRVLCAGAAGGCVSCALGTGGVCCVSLCMLEVVEGVLFAGCAVCWMC